MVRKWPVLTPAEHARGSTRPYRDALFVEGQTGIEIWGQRVETGQFLEDFKASIFRLQSWQWFREAAA